MTNEQGHDDYGAVCPYLGLADDADSHATYATEAHRCFRLPNPTRIATGHQETYCLGANHVSCPVYLGEGVPGAAAPQPAAGAVPPPVRAPQRPEPAAQTVRGPRPGEAPPRPGRDRPGTDQGRAPRRPSPGAIGPRPRSGGISLPVATIGLFSLAIVVVVLAFAINKLSGGSSSGDTPQVSRNQTATAAAAGALKTGTVVVGTRPTGTTTAGANQTPGASQTATGSQTPAGGGAGTYTVKAGDTCSGIASANNIDLQTLLNLNNLTEESCRALAVGQVLKLK